jgi:glycerophosphoryl diester phosphodiesterase
MLHAPAQILIPLLNDSDPRVRQETLLAMSRCEGSVASGILLPFLSDPSPLIRGAAALALARHQPEAAATAVPEALAKDEQLIADDYAIYLKRGKPKLTQQEIDPIVLMYRGQMKIVQAGELLRNEESLKLLESQAFRSVEDYSLVAGLIAGYQLWDRAPKHPAAEIAALGSPDADIANRAEWILVKAGPAVLPAVRDALESNNSNVRQRAIRIVAWQGDVAAVDKLHALTLSHPEDERLVGWAVDKIGILNW